MLFCCSGHHCYSPCLVRERIFGIGWDLHRLEEGKRLVIGGVDVPHTKGTIAHSDGGNLTSCPLALSRSMSQSDLRR